MHLKGAVNCTSMAESTIVTHSTGHGERNSVLVGIRHQLTRPSNSSPTGNTTPKTSSPLQSSDALRIAALAKVSQARTNRAPPIGARHSLGRIGEEIGITGVDVRILRPDLAIEAGGQFGFQLRVGQPGQAVGNSVAGA